MKFPIFFIGFSFILYNFAFFVGKNAVDVPFWDQWGLVDILTKKMNFLELLRYQHNEHRIGVGLIIVKFLSSLSHWSQVLEIKFVSFMIISSSFIILYLKKIAARRVEVLDLFIPLVILNIFQFENIDWGFQISFVLPLLLFSFWLLTTKIKNVQKRNTILTAISLFATYSIFHGLIIPVLTMGYLIFDYWKFKRENVRLLLFFLLANIAILCSFFIGYKKEFQTSPLSHVSGETLRYFSLALGNGFFYSLNNPTVNYFITVLTLFFLVFGIFRLTKKREFSQHLFTGTVLILFAFLFISLIAIGRSTFGVEQALSSRYVTFTMLIPLGLFFIFSELKKGVYLKIILLIFIAYNIFFLSSPIRSYAKMMTTGKQKALECYTSGNSDYSDCFKMFKLFPDEEYLNKRIPAAFGLKRINYNSQAASVFAPAYLNSIPEDSTASDFNLDISKKMQNMKKKNGSYLALNDDPNFSIPVSGTKGISWRSTARGNAKLYYLFEGNKDYSETNMDDIKGSEGLFSLNIESLEKKYARKLISLRIDPTDMAEEFKIEDFKIYK